MTIFGLKESEVATLVRAVAPDSVGAGLDRAGIASRFARATLGGLAEPGDRMAGVLVQSLGASTALTAIIDQWAPERVAAEVIDAGESVDVGDIVEAFDRWRPRVVSGQAVIALRQAARFGARLIVPGDTVWPEGVNDLGAHGPMALWVRGTDAALGAATASISLVGARAATGYGEHVTMEAAAGLVDRGYAIVSGAAYGIDGMAHRATLASRGHTIAILAGGVDRFYPSGHDALLTRIVETGAVISELPCGAAPTRWRFLQRNRLIAAMSQATVVLEAGWRSGSLNTAGHAGTLGRPLGAVPGPVTSATSAGCHKLIREFAAICVTSAEEMAELAPLGELRGSRDVTGDRPGVMNADNIRFFDALSTRSGRTVDEIAAGSGLSVAAVQSLIAGAEFEGTVAERERGWVKKIPRG